MMIIDIETLLKYERYIRVMGYAEIAQIKAGRRDWSIEDIRRWELLLALREMERDNRIRESMKRSRKGAKCKISASKNLG